MSFKKDKSVLTTSNKTDGGYDVQERSLTGSVAHSRKLTAEPSVWLIRREAFGHFLHNTACGKPTVLAIPSPSLLDARLLSKTLWILCIKPKSTFKSRRRGRRHKTTLHPQPTPLGPLLPRHHRHQQRQHYPLDKRRYPHRRRRRQSHHQTRPGHLHLRPRLRHAAARGFLLRRRRFSRCAAAWRARRAYRARLSARPTE